MPKASINAIITIIRNAQRLGVDINVLQKRVGITPDMLSDPEKRIDSLIGFRLMEEAENMANDPLFGLHHGREFQPADMGLVGFLVLNASTAKQAVESFCKFQRIYGEGMQIQSSTAEGNIEVVFALHPELDVLTSYGPYFSHMSGFISTVNWLLNQKITPIEVKIAMSAPAKLIEQKEITQAFGENIRYSASSFSIIYRESCFESNVLTNNPELFKLFEHRAQMVMEQFGDKEDFKSQVASCLLKTLDSKKPTLDMLSDQLHKSPRTIQRLLKTEGTSFQEVLANVRQKSAKYYLESSSLSIDEIAYLLGFSDASAFRKSFKKSNHTSPEAFRKQVTA